LRGYKNKLGVLAKGRRIHESDEEFHLREEMGTYNNVFDGKYVDIGPSNTYYWSLLSHKIVSKII